MLDLIVKSLTRVWNEVAIIILVMVNVNRTHWVVVSTLPNVSVMSVLVGQIVNIRLVVIDVMMAVHPVWMEDAVRLDKRDIIVSVPRAMSVSQKGYHHK